MKQTLPEILTDKALAQFGDSLLNFAYSVSVTENTNHPNGIKVSDKILAEAAVKAGLRKHLPRRVGRGDVANSIEALLGFVWLNKFMTLEQIVECLKSDSLRPAENFARLAELALMQLDHE